MAAPLKTGDNSPDFNLPAWVGGEKAAGDDAGCERQISLQDYRGKKLVLYFYPKDDTPGCTKESCGFNEALKEFEAANIAVVGVSKDTLKKHAKFAQKYALSFPLLSDEDGTLCEAYGTWVEKKMYGRQYMGIERATFLIDEDGKIQEIWRKVKVAGHVEAVLAASKS